jgi:hypothetical protein
LSGSTSCFIERKAKYSIVDALFLKAFLLVSSCCSHYKTILG